MNVELFNVGFDQSNVRTITMLLLATSPGARGGGTVLDIAVKRMPFQGGLVKGSFSLPSFNENFDTEKGIISNRELNEQLLEIINSIEV